MPEPVKLLIGIPSGDRVHADFCFSLAGLVGVTEYPFSLCPIKGSLIVLNRNAIVRAAQKDQATHLLMIDTDMMFPPIAANRLMSVMLERDLDILGASYRARRLPHRSMLIPLPGQEKLTEQISEVQMMPTGMMCINMRVFEKLDKPYFRHPVLPEYDNPEISRIGGEDYDFCSRARELGFKVFVDLPLSLSIRHITDIGVVATGEPPFYRYVMDSDADYQRDAEQ